VSMNLSACRASDGRWRGPILVISLLMVALGGSTRLAAADIVHLKNGRRITADSVRIEGDRLVLETAAGSMTIPRGDVASIEKGSPAKKSTALPATPGGAKPLANAPAPSPAAASPSTSPPASPSVSPGAPAAPSSAGGAAATDWLADGIEALGARRYERAQSSFLAALASDPRSTPAALGLVASQLGAGDASGARGRARLLVAEHPDSSQGWLLLGETEYALGDITAARRAFEKSRTLKDTPELAAWIERLQSEEKASKGYGSLRSGHFRLEFDPGSAPVRAREALAFLDSIYEEMAGIFRHHPSEGLDVVLYPRDSFQELTGFGNGVLGLYDGKIRIPTGGPDQLTASDRATFRHELAHAFIDSKTSGHCPRWLHEGLAQRVEPKSSRGSESLLVSAGAGEAALRGEFTYGSALGFVDYLFERFGPDRMNLLLDKLAAEPRLDEATRWAFGAPCADLADDWGKSLRARPPGR